MTERAENAEEYDVVEAEEEFLRQRFSKYLPFSLFGHFFQQYPEFLRLSEGFDSHMRFDDLFEKDHTVQ